MGTHTHICTIPVYTSTPTQTYMLGYAHTYMYRHAYIYTHTHPAYMHKHRQHTHTCSYMCVHTGTHVHTCTHARNSLAHMHMHRSHLQMLQACMSSHKCSPRVLNSGNFWAPGPGRGKGVTEWVITGPGPEGVRPRASKTGLSLAGDGCSWPALQRHRLLMT